MNGKKIIRIAGTSYSGSTMLDLMLANGEECFSCGEINALFRPYRKHHFTPVCDCGNPDCDIWSKVKKTGELQLWENLFQLQGNAQVFVDSSKDLVWLYDQNRVLLPRNSVSVNVLVWKSPIEFALSCWKRKKFDSWYGAYTSYHERYFSIINHWYSVKFSELTNNPPQKLQSLCEMIGINYFLGKENYWDDKHHTLFGSHSAKLHLYNKNGTSYSEIVKSRSIHKSMVSVDDTDEVKHHKQIYSVDQKQFDVLPDEARRLAEEDERLLEIHSILQNTEINNISGDNENAYIVSDILKPKKGWYLAGKIKRLIRATACKVT